jgi:hypothetical protein
MFTSAKLATPETKLFRRENIPPPDVKELMEAAENLDFRALIMHFPMTGKVLQKPEK